MARLSFRCDDYLLNLVDEARGEVARERWLRNAVEAAAAAAAVNRYAATHQSWRKADRAVAITTDEPLAPGDERGTVASVSDGLALDAAMTRARRLRSSQQVKADVQPRQKGK